MPGSAGLLVKVTPGPGAGRKGRGTCQAQTTKQRGKKPAVEVGHLLALMAAGVPRMGSVVGPHWPCGQGDQAAEGSNWRRHIASPPVLPRGTERDQGVGGNQSHMQEW